MADSSETPASETVDGTIRIATLEGEMMVAIGIILGLAIGWWEVRR